MDLFDDGQLSEESLKRFFNVPDSPSEAIWAESARTLRMLMDAMLKEGFTDDQAFEFVKLVYVSAIAGGGAL